MPVVLLGFAALALIALVARGDGARTGKQGSAATAPMNEAGQVSESVQQYGGDRADSSADVCCAEAKPAVDITARATAWPYPVLWARVRFDDGTGQKVRPVVVHSFDDNGLVVSPMYSRGRCTNTCFFLRVDRESALTYDRKGNCGYVAVTSVMRLSFDDVVDRNRKPGALSHACRKQLVAALVEWQVDV